MEIVVALYKTILYNIVMKNKSYKTTGNAVYSCKYCMVWCTQYRRPLFTNEKFAYRIKEVIEKQCAELEVTINELCMYKSHVYLKADIPPKVGPYRCLKLIKMSTGKCARAEYPQIFTRVTNLWTTSYLIKSLGIEPYGVDIEEYILKQKTRQ